LTSINGM